MPLILENVTLDSVGAAMAQAGIRPGQKVRVTVETPADRVLTAMDDLGREARAAGLTPESVAEELGMNADEFEAVFGRAPDPTAGKH